MTKTNPVQSAKDTSNSANKYGSKVLDILSIYNDLNNMQHGKTGGERIISAASMAKKIMAGMG